MPNQTETIRKFIKYLNNKDVKDSLVSIAFLAR